MVNATSQLVRDRRDSSVPESEPAAIRSLGTLEHLFWLLDQHRSVHFAVTALISGKTSPRDWRRARSPAKMAPDLVGLHLWRAGFGPLVAPSGPHSDLAATRGG